MQGVRIGKVPPNDESSSENISQFCTRASAIVLINTRRDREIVTINSPQNICRTFQVAKLSNDQIIRTIARAVRIENVANDIRRPSMVNVRSLINAAFPIDSYFRVAPLSSWVHDDGQKLNSRTDARCGDSRKQGFAAFPKLWVGKFCSFSTCKSHQSPQ